MSNVNPNQAAENQKAAQAFAQSLAKYPIEEQIAISMIAANFLNGCSWQFSREVPELKNHREAFAKNPNVSLQEVSYSSNPHIGGYLVSMNFEYMAKVLAKEAPSFLNPQNLDYIKRHRSKALTDLAKLLGGGFKGRLGVYCTNDSSTITKDGKTYPAFAVTFLELLQVCKKANYGVVIDGIARNPDDVFKRSAAILKAATVAPSSNAIMLDVAPLR